MNINDLTAEELYELRMALQHRINFWSGEAKVVAETSAAQTHARAKLEKLRKLQQKLFP